MSDDVRIHGLPELKAKLTPKLVAGPMRRLMDRWGLGVVRGAMDRVPVWRSHLRRGQTHEVDRSDPPQWARAGTNVPYGPPVEHGTGLLSTAPDSKKRRYFPPPSALDPWARAHGTTGGAVAAAIFRAGGTKPRPFLRPAFEEQERNLPALLAQAAKEIEAEAERA